MHIFCLDYTVSVSKSYPLRVQNKLTTSHGVCNMGVNVQCCIGIVMPDALHDGF